MIKQKDEIMRNTDTMVSDFSGEKEPKEYLEWERKAEYFLDHCVGRKNFMCVSLFFTYKARNWWENLIHKRRINGQAQVDTWEEMKDLLRERFAPRVYRRDKFRRLQSLSQGNRTVDEYYEEMVELMEQAQIEEDESETMSYFLFGLNKDIHEKLVGVECDNLEHLLYLAKLYERKLKKKKVICSNPVVPVSKPMPFHNIENEEIEEIEEIPCEGPLDVDPYIVDENLEIEGSGETIYMRSEEVFKESHIENPLNVVPYVNDGEDHEVGINEKAQEFLRADLCVERLQLTSYIGSWLVRVALENVSLFIANLINFDLPCFTFLTSEADEEVNCKETMICHEEELGIVYQVESIGKDRSFVEEKSICSKIMEIASLCNSDMFYSNIPTPSISVSILQDLNIVDVPYIDFVMPIHWDRKRRGASKLASMRVKGDVVVRATSSMAVSIMVPTGPRTRTHTKLRENKSDIVRMSDTCTTPQIHSCHTKYSHIFGRFIPFVFDPGLEFVPYYHIQDLRTNPLQEGGDDTILVAPLAIGIQTGETFDQDPHNEAAFGDTLPEDPRLEAAIGVQKIFKTTGLHHTTNNQAKGIKT